MRLPGEGYYLCRAAEVDIEQHLAKHREVLRALAFRYGRGNIDLVDDCYQAGIEALMVAHDRPTYQRDHRAELLTYGWLDVRKAMLKEVKLVKTELPYGIKEELDTLQEIAERQDRNRLHLDPLYDEPIEGLKPPLESTLTEDEQELAEKLRANLSAVLSGEELEILEASYGRTQEAAAVFLGLAKTTYLRRLVSIQAKARELARELALNLSS
jgi:RNA polymerase sigma factor (sigma-70 family)